MNNDFEYFNSDDFRKCLKEYERARDEGTTMFLDVNDFADIADYYNQMGNSKEAMTAINHGLDIFPGEAVLLSSAAICIRTKTCRELKNIWR